MGNLFLFVSGGIPVSSSCSPFFRSGAENSLLTSLLERSTFLSLLLCSLPHFLRFRLLSFFCISPNDFTSRQHSVLSHM